jgi:hypothetical protein
MATISQVGDCELLNGKAEQSSGGNSVHARPRWWIDPDRTLGATREGVDWVLPARASSCLFCILLGILRLVAAVV